MGGGGQQMNAKWGYEVYNGNISKVNYGFL